jgi:hypothetical protein
MNGALDAAMIVVLDYFPITITMLPYDLPRFRLLGGGRL